MQRINKLDGLRGLFAIFVVLFHLNINNAPFYLVNNFFVRASYVFVDFFFILSGYVISLTYNQSILNGKQFVYFIKKRFIRLYPLLLCSTFMYWYFVHPIFNKHNLLLALDTLFLTNSTPILGSDIGMNYPSWSISSEMISYIVFATCSIVAIQKRKTILIGIITLACFSILAYQQNYFQTGYLGFVRGLACFNLGYFVYVLAKYKYTLPNSLEFIMTTFIIGLMYVYHTATLQKTSSIFLIQLLIPICFATYIWVLIKTNGILSKMLQTKPFLFLGKISYSVYLNQALVIGYSIPKLYRWISFTNGDAKKTLCIFLLLILLVIYSWATQFLIETRLGKKIASILKS